MSLFIDTIVGLVLIAVIFLVIVIYSLYASIRDEPSKRGRIARITGDIVCGTLMSYIAICSIVGLIIGLIAIFT